MCEVRAIDGEWCASEAREARVKAAEIWNATLSVH